MKFVLNAILSGH